jgi:hypothetical protein
MSFLVANLFFLQSYSNNVFDHHHNLTESNKETKSEKEAQIVKTFLKMRSNKYLFISLKKNTNNLNFNPIFLLIVYYQNHLHGAHRCKWLVYLLTFN